MQTDRATMNYAAALISTVGSVAGLASALLPRGKRDAATRIALFSGLLGLIGSIAWMMAARGDHLDAKQQAHT